MNQGNNGKTIRRFARNLTKNLDGSDQDLSVIMDEEIGCIKDQISVNVPNGILPESMESMSESSDSVSIISVDKVESEERKGQSNNFSIRPIFQELEEPKRILIVDDEVFNLDALEVILQFTTGLDPKKTCQRACNGQDALNHVINNVENNSHLSCSFELILMDCNMPLMDGYDSTLAIREYLYKHNLPQPIIAAVTGHTEDSYVDKAIQSGMNQVLSKPVQIDLMKNLVDLIGF